jgi:ABC-type transport system involved in cytochrome bd biosynthesis fused ATPase/permease subunit
MSSAGQVRGQLSGAESARRKFCWTAKVVRDHEAGKPADPFVAGGSGAVRCAVRSRVQSLRDVNLELTAGSRVIIIGTNGSGKSTLLNAVAGTFFVYEGSIRLAGQDVTRWPEHARPELLGRRVSKSV